MELTIKNGDYVPDGKGGVARRTGSAALLERVIYKLTARREGFPFIPELGSSLYRLGRIAPRERSGAAEEAVREALRDETELEVTKVELSEADGGLYTLRVSLVHQKQLYEVALTVQ